MANFHGGQHQFNIGTVEINHWQQYGRPDFKDAIQALSRARAIEATDISNVAAYAPRCSPGSRTRTLQDIMAWIQTPTTSILWISGVAGAGKTCVMREVVKRCRDAGFITWTYFFNFRHARLTIEQPFVATLVWQMIDTIPALRPFVLQTIEDDPDGMFNPQVSLDRQMKTLLMPALDHPPLQMDPAAPSKITILVDAIDECVDRRERGNLLRLLHSLTQRKRPTIVVVVASRPEPDLRTAYDAPVLKSATTHLSLEKYDTSSDVRHFLCGEFETIRNTHPLAPEDWPDEDTLSQVEAFCGGKFLVASTIAKYIEDKNRNPVDLLTEILSLDTSRGATPSDHFAHLDRLYTHILHPPKTDVSLTKRLLHAAVVLDSSGSGIKLACLDALFALAPGTTLSIAKQFNPVIDHSKDRFTFRHKSLRDYLLSEDRSGGLFRSRPETCIELATAIAEGLQAWYTQDPSEPHPMGSIAHQWCQLVADSGVVDLPVDEVPAAIITFDPRVIFCDHFLACISRSSGGAAGVLNSSWSRLSTWFHRTIVSPQHLSSRQVSLSAHPIVYIQR